MHGMVVPAQPWFELVVIVRIARYTGVAYILHGEEAVGRGKIDHDPVLGT